VKLSFGVMINIKIYRYIAILKYKFEFCLSVNFQFYESGSELIYEVNIYCYVLKLVTISGCCLRLWFNVKF